MSTTPRESAYFRSPAAMASLSRRAFLATSLTGLAAGRLLGADPPAPDPKAVVEDPAFQPSTLFLTSHRDPTTTMTVQWVGTAGETDDPTVYFAPAGPPPGDARNSAYPWQIQPTTARPYPRTDFKVFRAELTGLIPDMDYQF